MDKQIGINYSVNSNSFGERKTEHLMQNSASSTFNNLDTDLSGLRQPQEHFCRNQQTAC